MPHLDARTVLTAAAVLLVAAGIAGLASLDAPAPTLPSVAAVAAPGVTLPPASSMARPPSLPGPTPAQAWSADDSTQTVAQRYRDARDLRDFYQRALETGGMAHLWFAQAALLRCAHVIRVGLVGAEQEFAAMDLPQEREEERRLAHRDWIQPCKGFETRPYPPGELQRINARLRDTAGLVGEAYRFSLRREATPEERRAHLRTVVSSGDAYIVGVFAPGAADLKYGPYRYGRDAASLESNRRLIQEHRAWSLAACELGMDCGRGSLTWYNACVGSGDCSEANALSGAAAEVGKAALPAVLQRRDEIVAAVRSRDWDVLGL